METAVLTKRDTDAVEDLEVLDDLSEEDFENKSCRGEVPLTLGRDIRQPEDSTSAR